MSSHTYDWLFATLIYPFCNNIQLFVTIASRLPHRPPIFPLYPQRASPFIRPLSTTPVRRLKEDTDRSGHEIEAKKQEHLRKQERGEGHCYEVLGSRCKSHFKADRQNVDDHGSIWKSCSNTRRRLARKGRYRNGYKRDGDGWRVYNMMTFLEWDSVLIVDIA